MPWSPAVALPGRKNLGLGRHWHFMTIQFWILTGAVYVALIFATGYWHYLMPTSWSLFPDSVKSVGTYLRFRIPSKIPGQPFEPAQKLSYFLVILVLAPLRIASGAAMSRRRAYRPRHSMNTTREEIFKVGHAARCCLELPRNH